MPEGILERLDKIQTAIGGISMPTKKGAFQVQWADGSSKVMEGLSYDDWRDISSSGGSIKQVSYDLTPFQKRWVAGQNVLLLPDEAKALGWGIDIPEGWMLSVTPPKNGDAVAYQYISPDGTTVTEDKIGVYPDRWEIISEQPQIAESDITGLITDLYPEIAMDIPESERPEFVLQFLEDVYNDPDAAVNFLNKIQRAGENVESVALLHQLAPELTDANIKEFFSPGVSVPLDERPVASYLITEQPFDAVRELASKDSNGFRQALLFEGRNEQTEALLQEVYGGKLPESFLNDYFTVDPMTNFARGTWLPDGLKDYWRQYWTGVGDIFTLSSGVADRMGASGVAASLKRTGIYGQQIIKADNPEPNTPEWYAKNLTRMVPMLLGFIELGLVTGGSASSLVASSGGGSFLQGLVGAITAGITTSLGEGALEAGGAYQEAQARGLSKDEQNAVFDKVLLHNFALLSISNSVQFGLTFFVPGGRTTSLVTKALVFGFDAASEGIEEGAQLAITRGALGDVQVFDQEMLDNIKLGVAGGFGFAGIGAVYTQVQTRVQSRMSETEYGQLRKDIGELMAKGYSRKAAEAFAWDKYAETPSGKAAITDVAKEIYTEEMLETQSQVGKVEAILKPAIEVPVTSTKEGVTPVAEQVPQAISEFGEADAGVQRAMMGVPEKNVVVQGKGKITQIGMDDALKLQQMREEQAPVARVETEQDEDVRLAFEEAKGLKTSLELDPVAQVKIGVPFKTKKGMSVRNVDLTSFISLREQNFPDYFTVKQAKQIRPHGNFENYNQPGLKTYNKVPRDVVLDDLTKSLNMSPDEIAARVEQIRTERRRIKELSEQVKAANPLPALPEPTVEEAKTNKSPTGEQMLSAAQVDKTLELYGLYVESPTAYNAWQLTRELRRKTRAERAGMLQARAQELITLGLSSEDAINQAKKETMTGALPEAKTDYLSDLTDQMRKVLFDKVYQTLKDEPFELMATTEALTNSLLGKPIPREPGAKGGSAYTRLKRVFGKQPTVFKALDDNAKANKKLEDIIEGAFRIIPEGGNEPTPVDAETAEYLRGLSSDIIYQPSAFREPEPVTPFETPIDDAFKQLPMIPPKVKPLLVRVLKDIGLTIIDIGNFLRANKASGDLSFWRQQAPLILNHPIAFWEANIEAWKAIMSKAAADASWERIISDPLYDLYIKGSNDFLRPAVIPKGTATWKGVEEYGYLSSDRPIPRFTQKIPWVKISERGFVTGVNEHNWRIFKQHYKNMLKVQERIASGQVKLAEGEAFSVQNEMSDFSKMLSDFTGRASLGKASQLAPVLSALLFAPRLALARLLTPRHLVSSNKYVRQEAWRNVVSFVGGFGGIILLGEMLDLWDVEKDPRSSEFMSIRIGNTRIDPWGGYRQYVVFFARLINGTGISSVTGTEYPIDPVGTITNFIRGKSAPLLTTVSDFWTGKTFVGEVVDVSNLKQWIERVAPFAAMDIYEAMVDDPQRGMVVALPAIFGAGVATYTGDWRENAVKLGLPKYTDNLFYGATEPVYDVKDFWADTASQFKGVDPETLTESKGFPPYIKAMVEAARFKEELALLPNEPLAGLNADPTKGTTYVQYYKMWTDREKIVASGDEDKLKEFDQDDRTKYAYLGNMSQRDYALLNQFHSITDEKEKKAFLQKHPELAINPRENKLRTSTTENAKLAIWGQAEPLSQAAYDEAQRLLKVYDIPEVAVADYIVSPELAKSYFERNDIVDQWGANSWEDKLFRSLNPELNDWLELGTTETPLPSLELKVKYRSQYDLLEGYSNRESPDYIQDEEKRKLAIEALRHTKVDGDKEFIDIKRTVEAIERGTKEAPTPEEIITKHLEYSKMQDAPGVGSSTAEVMLYRVDNPDYNEWRMDSDIWGEQALTPIDADRIPVWRIDAKYREEDAAYQTILNQYVGNIVERNKAIEAYLTGDGLAGEELTRRLEYSNDRLRRTAYDLHNPVTGERFPVTELEKYVAYNNLPLSGKRRDRFLINPDNAAFAKAMHEVGGIDLPDPAKVPLVQFDDIYDQYQEQFDRLAGLADHTSPSYVEDNVTINPKTGRTPRQQAAYELRFTNGHLNEFGKAEIRRDAYAALIPPAYTERHVDWMTLQAEGAPLTWPTDKEGNRLTWYEDDWYLIDHPKYYEDIYLKHNNLEPRDFTKVPTREVFFKYAKYKLLNEGFERLNYRWENRDLDDWLVKSNKVTVSIEEQRRRANMTPKEKLSADLRDWLERLKKTGH